MINQEYFGYWQQTIISITLLSNLIKENIEEELINQQWYEFELDRIEIEMLRYNLSDLEIQYTD